MVSKEEYKRKWNKSADPYRSIIGSKHKQTEESRQIPPHINPRTLPRLCCGLHVCRGTVLNRCRHRVGIYDSDFLLVIFGVSVYHVSLNYIARSARIYFHVYGSGYIYLQALRMAGLKPLYNSRPTTLACSILKAVYKCVAC